MDCVEIAAFEVMHRGLVWPWVSIDPTRARFAFATSDNSVATRAFVDGGLVDGKTFALPDGVEVKGFAIDPSGELLAVNGASVVVTGDVRTRIDALAGPDFIARAITFDRSGKRVWISAESGKETALIL